MVSVPPSPAADAPGLVLVTGPARGGKSRFAASLAARGPAPVTVVATGRATDPEMAARIAAHRRERPPGWRTVEEPVAAVAAVRAAAAAPGTVLLDCLGFLLANWLEEDASRAAAGPSDDELLARVGELAAAAAGRARVIVVSNEVGWGVVPPYPAGRRFRDLLGRANQVLAAAADQVWLVVAGLALEVKASGLAVPVGEAGRGRGAAGPGRAER